MRNKGWHTTVVIAIAAVSFAPTSALAGTGNGGWSDPDRIDGTPGYDARGASFSLGEDGYGVAAWHQYNGATYDIYANLLDPVSGWGTPARVEHDDAFDADSPIVAYVGGGRAFIAWTQWSNFLYPRVTAAFLEPTRGWTAPQVLDQAISAPLAVMLGVTGEGVGALVWLEDRGPYAQLYGRTLLPNETTWRPEQQISQGEYGASLTSMACDAGINCTVIWKESYYPNEAIWYAKLQADGGWAGQQVVMGYNNQYDGPAVAMGGFGNTIIAASQYVSSERRVYVRMSQGGGGFSPDAEISAGGNDDFLRAAMAGDGSAFVVYRHTAGANISVTVSHYARSTGAWAAPLELDTSNYTFTQEYQVVVNRDGSALVAWVYLNTGVAGMRSERFMKGEGWDRKPWLIYDENHVSPRSGIDGQGTCVVVWDEILGPLAGIRASRFTPPDLTPPTLSLTSPSEGASFNNTSVRVAGTTEPGASVSAAGVAGSVDAAGNFSFLVTLQAGNQTLNISARDAASNEAIVRVNISVTDPVKMQLAAAYVQIATLQANAASLAVDLADAQAELVVVRGDLAVAKADGNVTAADLATAEARLNATAASLAAVTADLEAAKTTIAQAQTQAGVMAYDLSAASAELNLTREQLDIERQRLNATVSDLFDQRSNIAKAQADTAAANARVSAVESSASLATTLAVVGLLVGAIGAVLGLRPRGGASRNGLPKPGTPGGPAAAIAPAPLAGPQAAAPAVPARYPCPQCGKPVADGSAQCAACGMRLTWG
jgi:hypothetical protein